jgi:L-fuconate dehydratase
MTNLSEIKITGIQTSDVRFPTSKSLDGSDAMNPDPDYSAAYLMLQTNISHLQGVSLVFTIGRGNDLQLSAIERLAFKVKGLTLDQIFNDNLEIYKDLGSDSQYRWLGPEYGIFHMARGAVSNALWDLLAKANQKPLWRYLAELKPKEIVNVIDFTYLEDGLNADEALQILELAQDSKQANISRAMSEGLPAYTTSPGWLGYDDLKMLHLTKEAVEDGFKLVKFKCGLNLKDDRRRLSLVREKFGKELLIAVDANQKWGVDEAIGWINELKEFDLSWVEEPTHPEDVVGHSQIAAAVAPTPIATGEMASSRITFKQLLKLDGQAIVQIDATRVGGVNENLAIVLMARKFKKSICPHAGGVGLCEMVQHLAFFNAVAVSGFTNLRYIEFVDHLHEHFKYPVEIRNGHYQAPKNPGMNADMKESSVSRYTHNLDEGKML